MTDKCGEQHPNLADVRCTLDPHPGPSHSYVGEFGEINWKAKKPVDKATYSMEQLEQVIEDHEIKLQQTMDTMQSSHGVHRDVINTLIPPMQTQLFLIKETLKLIKE